ncbi:hypothetical protein GN958_ATG02420, partial [Phytophthora infestans]
LADQLVDTPVPSSKHLQVVGNCLIRRIQQDLGLSTNQRRGFVLPSGGNWSGTSCQNRWDAGTFGILQTAHLPAGRTRANEQATQSLKRGRRHS